MRCGYCHNPELVLGKKTRLPWADIMQFLRERQPLLDGVVLSGGECTLSPHLPEFIRMLREMGYQIKLDTNGSHPVMLKALLCDELVDYVALDYKAPMDKLESITEWGHIGLFRDSLRLLCESGIAFEVRTTVHTALLDEHDIAAIMADLEQFGFKGNYYIQNFQSAPATLRPLPEQHRKLDVHALPEPESFSVHVRNF